MIINDRFVDVDFAKQPEFCGGDLGRVAMPGTFASYEQSVPIIPESDWRRHVEAMDEDASGAEWLVKQILNQRQEGSCVGFATTQALKIALAKKYGLDRTVDLSGISVYKQIGRSASSGATIPDGFRAITGTGALPLDTPENRNIFGEHVMPATGFATPFPDGWRSTAAKFRAVEVSVIRTVAGIYTALLRREPVVVGRQGHAICYVRPAYRNGRLGAIYANSWGAWGFGAGNHSSGFGFDSANLVAQSAGWAFAIRSVT